VTAASGTISQAGRPTGLLEKLLAVIRPEFRREVLVFDPRDPVFGGPLCAVPECGRPARCRQMCWSHSHRWMMAGKPDPAVFAATTSPGWAGHCPLPGCQVTGCGYALAGHGLCYQHFQRWTRAGRPNLASWQTMASPPSPAPATCRVSYCTLWAKPTSVFCHSHHKRWHRGGRADVEEFIASCRDPGPGHEYIDLRCLPGRLRLEVQYVLQCRRDEARSQLVPVRVHRFARDLAATGVASLLDRPEDYWASLSPRPGQAPAGLRAFTLDAYRRVEQLAFGSGWDLEYPRDRWRPRNLGITERGTILDFGKISQPWLRGLAKRWIRWRLSTGVSISDTDSAVRVIQRFSAFLASPGVAVDSLARVDRPLLERYLADLHQELGGRKEHTRHISALNVFLRAIRQHGWDPALPGGAVFYPEDYPRQPEQLPRALADHVMSQLEQPGNLDRWDNPVYRLITLILMRCGLRISDALKLPFACVVSDSDGAPYLRYSNHKMKREALVPIDDELQAEISSQQQRVLQRWPDGAPVLLPRPNMNLGGHQPIAGNTYRDALSRWLERCDIRNEHGQLVHLTPHQWRHTLGTRLINRDVPQEVVRRILDHDSHQMTAHYARLSDATIRRHWERARKVDIRGDTVVLDPDGPLAEAAWAKQRLSRAVQALPNGYCGLPLVRRCQHANACLTCPLFITTAEFLPGHRRQHQQTLQIISAAQARGQARMAEMNQQVADSLQRIITALEADQDPQEGAADVS
jgi:integrase